MAAKHNILKILSIIAILAMIFSSFHPSTAQAQSEDGLQRQVNAESGRVSIISPENGKPLSAPQALGTFIRPENPALALAKRFGPEFGLKNPERDLAKMKNNQGENGRLMVRYQQLHQGIPVIGGELIVNTNENGDLYSISGEVSPDLALQTQPAIDPAQAKETALQSLAKWYQKTPEDFTTTEPELWIYDESLLQPGTRPAELVWRMEVIPVDSSLPVRELVLVNAERGGISLHFNQVDTTWKANETTDTRPSRTPEPPQPTETPLPTETPDSVITFLPEPVEPQLTEEASSIEKAQDQSASLTATTWYVATTGNDSNSCLAVDSPCATISGALGKAASGDTIKIAIGTYIGSGYEVVNISKNITLSSGWDASFTVQSGYSTIDGQGVRRGITVSLGSVALDRLIIQNGFDSSQGGGIRNNAILTVSDSKVINNASNWMGGGVYNYGTLTIDNVTISGNRAGQQGHTGGGGGAGIQNYDGTVTLNNSTVSGNFLYGGFSGSGIDNFDKLILNNSTVSNNTGGGGEGIYAFVGDTILNNSTITGNELQGVSSLSGSLTVKNTIIAGNGTMGYDCDDFGYGGSFISQGYNLIGKKSPGCAFVTAAGDLFGTSVYPINPRLAPLQANGGSTFTHALMIGSPAIDAGSPATPGSEGSACLSIDQRGVARPIGVRCDIGAYEGSVAWVPSPLVNTYTASNSSSLPGYFRCDQTDPSCAAGDSHAKAAHKYAIGSYNLYATNHLRDSIDNSGMVITSTVHYCSSYYCPYGNAFWNGEQMVYGDAYGFPLADDVVAHELTHGVTDYESNLFYYYQSGAINESFSDLWGEYYDQTNGLGTDTSGVKWLIGEDVSGLGVMRSMSNPPAYGDPDKMTSQNYQRLPYYDIYWDNGGVHTNSGVNNKAVYLMVDGGTFNGKTVTALGWEKVGAIYYEVQTNLLSSGADYSDLYYGLQQACTNLIGQKGITAGNCTEVKDALDAVEMNAQPVANFNTDAPVCSVGTPVIAFADDLENGTTNWMFNNGNQVRWQYDSPWGQYAQSGEHFLYADDYPQYPYETTDARATLRSFVVPNNAYLHFAQAYEFEYDPSGNYDGGVLEYSTNGGTSWVDAGPLMDYNGYRGTIYSGYINPLKGRSAFVGSSHGYISTRLNLSSLAGKTVFFRWRMGLDDFGVGVGWWVDNIKVYTCVSHTISGNVGAAGVTLSYMDGTLKTSRSNIDGNYALQVSPNWSGTVTLSHPCFTFTPGDRTYSTVTANQTGQNYEPIFNGSLLCSETVGVFRPSNGVIFLKNSNTSGFADVALNYGLAGDYPVTGDWDGNGTDTIGVYRNGRFLLRNSNTVGFAEINFLFGLSGDQPIAGDWDGDGDDTIGVYRPSIGQFLLRNSNSAGPAEITFYLGNVGDVGIAGDWNGDGIDTTGVFRPSNGIIFLKNTNDTGFADVALNYGLPGDKPVVGDWDDNGTTTIGVFRMGRFYLRNSNTNGFADIILDLGFPTDMPIAGNWDGIP